MQTHWARDWVSHWMSMHLSLPVIISIQRYTFKVQITAEEHIWCKLSNKAFQGVCSNTKTRHSLHSKIQTVWCCMVCVWRHISQESTHQCSCQKPYQTLANQARNQTPHRRYTISMFHGWDLHGAVMVIRQQRWGPSVVAAQLQTRLQLTPQACCCSLLDWNSAPAQFEKQHIRKW